MKTLKKIPQPGDQGEDVKIFQAALKAAGFSPGPIDGVFGAKTLSSTKRLQLSNGLPGSGIPGEKTMALLGLKLEVPITQPSTPEPETPITTGKDEDEGTKPWYRRMFKFCVLDPGTEGLVERVSDKLLASKTRYEATADVLWNDPGLWWILAGIHYKEASGSFLGCLANGEKIIGTGRKTTIVPVGRGPYETWEESAIDAMRGENLGKVTDFEIGNVLFAVERYNGTGYIKGAGREDTSPYLWACTNINDGKGKFVRDFVYDKDASTNASPGFCALVKYWLDKGYITVKVLPD